MAINEFRSTAGQSLREPGIVVDRQAVDHEAAESVHERGRRLELAGLSLDQRPAGVVELDLSWEAGPRPGPSAHGGSRRVPRRAGRSGRPALIEKGPGPPPAVEVSCERRR